MKKSLERIYRHENDTFGFPQTYKGIDFYPIRIKDNKMRMLFSRFMSIPKNYIPDKTILKMSHLKFLIYVVQKMSDDFGLQENFKEDLIKLLSYVTKKNVSIDHELSDDGNANIFDKIKISILIDDIKFSEFEFDNIREIILEQNGSSIEYVESYIPDLEKKLGSINREDPMDYNDEIFSFRALTGMKLGDIGDLTLFQFKHIFEREILLKEYELFKPLEISGQIKSKNGKQLFKHYLSHISKKGRYDSILTSEKEFLDNSGLPNPNRNGEII